MFVAQTIISMLHSLLWAQTSPWTRFDQKTMWIRLQRWMHIKKSFSIVFTPFLPPHKKITDFFNSRKRVPRPRSETLCRNLSSVKPSRRSLIYYLSLHLATMECSFSVHTRVDTLARLLPFFFEIVYEKMYLKDPTVFKRQNGNMKLRYYSPTTKDFIKMLLEKDNTGKNYIENAKVSTVLTV